MTLSAQTKHAVASALKTLFPDVEINNTMISVNLTKPEFTRDYTVVLFPFVKLLRMKPDALGEQLGNYLVQNTGLFSAFSIVSGFLNLSVKDSVWGSFLQNNFNNAQYGEQYKTDNRVMVEYSSPNTNKPLHFGHLRNIFLGAAVSEVLKSTGNEVVKATLINDRGIHICKSMIAWQHFANGATPSSSELKGDHLVGDYYVKFNDELKKDIKPHLSNINEKGEIPSHLSLGNQEKIKNLISEVSVIKNILTNEAKSIDNEKISKLGVPAEIAIESAIEGNKKWKNVVKCFDSAEDLTKEQIEQKQTELKKLLKKVTDIEEKIDKKQEEIEDIVIAASHWMLEAQEMLRKWEAGDKDVRDLWQRMNGWVYDGFDVTYNRLGITFDKKYYESETYLLGKKIVEDGLQKGALFTKENGSVWIDLKEDGLDEKLLLRGDGTSVYITQDLGTAKLKHDDYNLNQSVYVIGDEQNYHMQVLKLILKKVGEPCADTIHHLSYGMVELPSGKMKSREGTVVDADDMVDEMLRLASEQAEEAGKTDGFTEAELTQLYETIGLGALKFYLLRVDPKKKMIFDPKESIDLHGFTATFIQYAHTRICSILRKEQMPLMPESNHFNSFKLTQDIAPLEKKLILHLEQYPSILEAAATEFNPSELCNYSFQLAQSFNTFYDVHSISKAENEEKKQLRLMTVVMTASVLRHAMRLLGIALPERM